MITVFYTPKMLAPVTNRSPSPGKPQYVVESWRKKFPAIEVLEPEPVSVVQLALAHEPQYVEGILACQIRNGFNNTSSEVASSLPYTVGSMLAATRAAIANGRVAVAPCSGFHHAGWDSCNGYCTFNGLMVAALAVKNEGLARRVGILDFDQHYGDGTEEIIDHLGIDWIDHYSAGETFSAAHQATEFLNLIPVIAKRMKSCDVVIYQAGADPHIYDPLGGWLTTAQLYERDRLVFRAFADLGVPVAWNLAGGYQEPLQNVLDIHDNTMRACCEVYAGGSR